MAFGGSIRREGGAPYAAPASSTSEEDGGTLIVNRRTVQGGQSYDESMDQARVRMRRSTLDETVETFQIRAVDTEEGRADRAPLGCEARTGIRGGFPGVYYFYSLPRPSSTPPCSPPLLMAPNRPATAARLPLLAALVLSGACGEAPADESWAGSVDTLETGTVVVRSPAEGLWEAGGASGHSPGGDAEARSAAGEPDADDPTARDRGWRLETVVRIGSVDGSGPEVLAGVADVELDGKGRIFVLERQAREIRVFDRDGTPLRSFGREGQGPGELAGPSEIGWGPEGRLWVTDGRNRRYTVFDTTGTHVADHPFISTGAFGFGNGWRDDGFLHEVVLLPDEAGESPSPGRLPPQGEARRRLEDGELVTVDTVRPPPIERREVVPVSFQQGDRTMSLLIPVPFAPNARREPAPDGSWWVSEGGPDYRIARVAAGGDTLRVLERPYERVPVTDEDRARAQEEMGGVEDEDLLERIPDFHPPVQALHPMPDGHLLVERMAPEGVVYDVFDPVGRFLGSLAGDVDLARFTVHSVTNDALAGMLPDDLGVPHVVVLEIVRHGG